MRFLRSSAALAATALALIAVPAVGASGVDEQDRPLNPARLHARILPFDVHLDIDTSFDGPAAPADRDGRGQFDLAKTGRGGVKAVALAIFVPQTASSPTQLADARAIADAKLRVIRGLAARYPQKAAIAYTPDDVQRIAASGRLALVQSIVNGGAFIDSLDDLDHWQREGVRIFGFVHAGNNRLADSSRPAVARGEDASRDTGLSALGKQAVERLNRLGMLIDVSQLSDAALADVLRLTRAPVIASHSDIRALVPNSRNLTDAQLDAIKANGGVVAINAFTAYLRNPSAETQAAIAALQADYGLTGGTASALPTDKAAAYTERLHQLQARDPKATVADLVNAVDYAVRRIGVDHVALSSDFNHGGGMTGWANEGEAANVTAELVRRGYTEGEIAKMWSGNALRIWGVAQSFGQKSVSVATPSSLP